MLTPEQEIEAAIREAGLTAPRITPDDLDAKIISAAYHRFPGTTLTVCALTLENGFVVNGESAAASPENYDQVTGEQVAYAEARDKIRVLEGYLLRERLYRQETGT